MRIRRFNEKMEEENEIDDAELAKPVLILAEDQLVAAELVEVGN